MTEENKELTYKQKWYQENKDEQSKYIKDWYQKNKEKHKKYCNEKILCECGKFIRRSAKANHLKSKNHNQLMVFRKEYN